MADSVAELQLSDYIDVVGRRKWSILLVAVVLLVAAITLSALQIPQFRAQARVRVEAASSSDPLDNSGNLSSNVRARNLQNEVEFANSDRVADQASETFGAEIGAEVTASSNSDTLSFSVVDDDAERAANIANVFAASYVSERSAATVERFLAAEDVINARIASIGEQRRTLLATNDATSAQLEINSLDIEEARLRGQLNQIDVVSQFSNSASVAILNAAEAPIKAFAPAWIRNIGLAVIAGLILGLVAALVLENLDDAILDKRDLERSIDGVPVLGVIPEPYKTRFGSSKERRLVTSRTGAFTEAFRSLRSAIELGQAAGSEIRTILVTSANASEGKSTVAAHLGVAFARSGANVLILDADMHNPTQHQLFDVRNQDGLADHLSSIGNADIVMEQASGEGLLSVITAGTSSSPPAEMLQSAAAQEFIEKLADTYDLVIIDSPPLRPVADTLPLARISDATLLVSMRGQTNASELEQAMELLIRAQTRPLGAVLCGAGESAGGYGYGYGAKRK
ncbi:MAG: capsular exopolysaccharide synthesis family protein [Verrucomicrobiales bacterium]|jgi:capsular exopolysaccharide synthesis family protein